MRSLLLICVLLIVIAVSGANYDYDALKTARLLKNAGLYGFNLDEACPNDKCEAGSSVSLDFSSVPCVVDDSCLMVTFDTQDQDASTLNYSVQYGDGEVVAEDSFIEFDFSKGKKVTLGFTDEFPKPCITVIEYSLFVSINTRYSETPVSGILDVGAFGAKLAISTGIVDAKTYKKFMTIKGKESDYVVTCSEEDMSVTIEANADYDFRLKEFMETVYPDYKAPKAYYRIYTTDRSGDSPMYITEVIDGDYEKRGLYVYHAHNGSFSSYSLSGIMGYFNDPETRTMAIAACVVAGLLVVGLCILGCYCCCCRKKPTKQAFGGMSQPQNQPRPPQSFAGGMQPSFQGPPQGMMGGPRY